MIAEMMVWKLMETIKIMVTMLMKIKTSTIPRRTMWTEKSRVVLKETMVLYPWEGKVEKMLHQVNKGQITTAKNYQANISSK